MNESELILMAEEVVSLLKEKNLSLATAESCTGGWVGKIITEVSGASAVYLGGVCSYANEVKMKLLGVSAETLRTVGAVSRETAVQMAEGVRKLIGSDIGIGITGIAGPLSDGTDKPVGLIYVAVSTDNGTRVTELRNDFKNDIRQNNRYSAVKTVLKMIGEAI